MDVNELCKSYKISPLYVRRSQQSLSMMYKDSTKPAFLCDQKRNQIVTNSSICHIDIIGI